MSEVSFGVFDWIDRGTQPLSQLYEDRLQLLAAADEAGFFCYHLAEHHATPLGMAPSPALFLTAAARGKSQASSLSDSGAGREHGFFQCDKCLKGMPLLIR